MWHSDFGDGSTLRCSSCARRQAPQTAAVSISLGPSVDLDVHTNTREHLPEKQRKITHECKFRPVFAHAHEPHQRPGHVQLKGGNEGRGGGKGGGGVHSYHACIAEVVYKTPDPSIPICRDGARRVYTHIDHQGYGILKIKNYSSCEIEGFVGTHLCSQFVILRSRVLLGTVL